MVYLNVSQDATRALKLLNKVAGVDSTLDQFRSLIDGGAWSEMSLPMREGSLSRGGGDGGESPTRSIEVSRRMNEMNQRLSDTTAQLRASLEEERQARANSLQGQCLLLVLSMINSIATDPCVLHMVPSDVRSHILNIQSNLETEIRRQLQTIEVSLHGIISHPPCQWRNTKHLYLHCF